MQNGLPLLATEILGEQGSPYPEPFASLATSTAFRRLGDRFGLTQLGVNMVTLDPGAQSGLFGIGTLWKTSSSMSSKANSPCSQAAESFGC